VERTGEKARKRKAGVREKENRGRAGGQDKRRKEKGEEEGVG